LVIVSVPSLRGVAQSSGQPIPLVPLSHTASGTADTGGPPVSVVPIDAPGLSPSISPRPSLAAAAGLPWPPGLAPAEQTHECEETHPPAAPHKERFHLEASWDNGLHFDSADDQFHVHVGGNAQLDSTWLIGPKGAFAIPGGGMNGTENASATFVRRA